VCVRADFRLQRTYLEGGKMNCIKWKVLIPKSSLPAVILASLIAFVPPLSIARADLYVPSTSESGVIWYAPSSATYRFTITSGAYTPWQIGHPDNEGWMTGVFLYKNRSVEWVERVPGYLHPGNYDFFVGSLAFQPTYEQAESIAKGMFVEIQLAKNEYVTLVVRDDKTWYYENSGGIYFSITPRLEPIASFTYSPENPMVGGNIIFDASASYDPDGTIVSYEWDFGDGNTASDEVVTHTYSEPGKYIVTLTVTDDDGLTDSILSEVNVVAHQPPVASFKSLNVIELGYPEEETTEGGHMVGGVIRFDPTESYDPDGEIIKYEWDFDNGVNFSTDMPNIYDITFEEARIYNVKLTVTDDDGLTNTFVETLDLSLKEGDLIFVRTAWWDIPFNIVFNQYTHVGMYIGGQWMIESIGFPNSRSSGRWGVTETPLSGWSYPSETYATLVRVETADDLVRQKAVAFARSKSGQDYDYNVWQKNVDKPNYYCSELIWAAYYKASKGKIELGKKKKDKGGVWPDDIIFDTDTVNTRVIRLHWEHNPR
jgi:PKD repeat protein